MDRQTKNQKSPLMSPRVLLFLLAIAICGMLVVIDVVIFGPWLSYDPAEAAVQQVSQCLDASIEDRAEICGNISESACFDVIDRTASDSDNQYTVEAAPYNREDERPDREGDEISVRVEYTNKTVFRFLWYEGMLEACEIGE